MPGKEQFDLSAFQDPVCPLNGEPIRLQVSSVGDIMVAGNGGVAVITCPAGRKIYATLVNDPNSDVQYWDWECLESGCGRTGLA